MPLMQGTIRLPPRAAGGGEEGRRRRRRPLPRGGAAARLPVTVRGEIRPSPLPSPPGLQSFDLANGPVREASSTATRTRSSVTKPRTLARQQLDARRRGDGARAARPAAAAGDPEPARDRGRVPRPERRDADRRGDGTALAGTLAAGRPRRPMGARARRPPGPRGGRRSRRHAGRGRAGAYRRLRAPDVVDPQARGRRLLRLRPHHRGPSRRRAVQGRHRRAGSFRLLGPSGDRRRPRAPGVGDGPGGAHRRHQHGRLGVARRAVVVRDRRRRPHRHRARAPALRARRDRALPGAHALPRGDRAGDRSSARA